MKYLLLRKILNGFKLFLALDVLVVTGFGVADILRRDTMPEQELIGSLVAVGVGALVGLLLLFWFWKTYKRLKGPSVILPEFQYESAFYRSFPALCRFIDGGSIFGFGTGYFTRNSQGKDFSFQAIKWLTIAHLPIFPLYQTRILIKSSGVIGFIPFILTVSSMNYQVLAKVPLSKKLIRLTYAFYFAFFLPALILPLVFMLVYLPELNAAFAGPRFWWLILGYLGWGILLVWLLDRWNTVWFLKREG